MSFRKFIKSKRPGAGFEGTNELRKDHIRKTPGQVDPIVNEKPTPHLEEHKTDKALIDIYAVDY